MTNDINKDSGLEAVKPAELSLVPITGSVVDTSDALIDDSEQSLHWVELCGKYKVALAELSGAAHLAINGTAVQLDMSNVPDDIRQDRKKLRTYLETKGVRTQVDIRKLTVEKMFFMVKAWNLKMKSGDALPITRENLDRLRDPLFTELKDACEDFEKSAFNEDERKNLKKA